ncbi:precorrin-2 C20-methyltransferase [Amycolatopsis mediterranei S699]|uniref:Precorrin-2 C20-methyltransferase n=2 Tax=Amycolatopsis mediterranei TaxID=33910 RepID=A0A0H3DGK6_AMYMU|nr:precorrin-2 C(20)-methyltransferase [Amycolatopsis mediterranei]ADJ48779.1 precorrin-2 C20-methyltransferase [Amycolatopsis mediterranei U32]AEK45719.1 precorrin-2 C20-methyltransferase [Amycolatopsis mediterranei S699]AFO80488.1 precorrin-2 C20-methyltransferase [Amycolatopsis mediterranei S699]AGT87616.1 precorrin-2 C20-methyltransferase [Amycolatopsis mediterranei RB]KDO03996.1 ATP-binding protein [Amycolatopsis mediterranei]
MTGTLYGVGLGPGDPELMTVKAARLISEASVIAYHCARHGRSIARSVAEPYLREGQLEEKLVYPVTTETTDHPGGYEGAIADFYELSAKRLAEHLDAGRDVVLLCEGDPFFYGSYMYMHERLAGRFEAVVVPGVTSVSAASSVFGRPLVQRDEVLTVLPGTLPAPELARRLADTDAAAVLKLGRTFSSVREAFAEAGKLDDAVYVERATWGQQRIEPLASVDPSTVPYFSLALLPSPAYASRQSSPAPAASPSSVGEVVVVGLGPAGPEWLTPEAASELDAAEHIVGYGPYVARVPQKAGQQRHASGNRVEADRAREALSLAASGSRVAVVSSGDPGVFAMASAVLEQVSAGHGAGVRVRIVPGVTAAQAAASRVGAPLGHDYCVLSLSDRLKPWEIIEKRLDAAGAADLVLALYNPASRTRTTQLADARAVLLRHRAPSTPVVVARDVGGPEEDIRITTLGELDPSTVDMRCLLIVGSSRTRSDNGIVWTPRSY